MKLEKRVALITGASQGIGRATALALAREGADLALAARNQPELERLADEIRALGRRALPVQMDVADEAQVATGVATAVKELGGIDILLTGAGFGFSCPVHEMTLGMWETTMAVNLRGTFLCCRAVLPIMMERRIGSIVNFSSADRGYALRTCYNATKFGIAAFTQGLAEEMAPYNVAVNCVRFGIVVDTKVGRDLHPGYDRSEWQRPEDVTDVILYLAAQDARGLTGAYVNVHEWHKQMRGPLGFAATRVPEAFIRQ